MSSIFAITFSSIISVFVSGFKIMYYDIYTVSLMNLGDYMGDKRQHVIKMAHQLFVDKGFQATSIQDILDYSGIAKGTFYNYFSSKNELLIEIFKSIYKNLEEERNGLLIGKDPSDLEVFIKQIELQLVTNRKHKLLSLFEEVIVSNDADLKEFIKQGQLRALNWLYHRLLDIFGESKQGYLLDCSVMFMGMLHHNIKYFTMVNGVTTNINEVVRYSVNRLVNMVHEVAESKEQLLEPVLLKKWLPDYYNINDECEPKLMNIIGSLRKSLLNHKEAKKYGELLTFIQEELTHNRQPRKFLLESTLLSLKQGNPPFSIDELQKLDTVIKQRIEEV